MLAVGTLAIIGASGLVAGFLTGLVGLGGAFIVVPAIYQALLAAGVSSHSAFTTAVATSITFVLFSSSSAGIAYARKSMVDYRLLAILSISAIAGVWFGVNTLLEADDQFVRYAFGGFIWFMGVYMVLSKRYRWGQDHAGERPRYTFLNQAFLFLFGAVVGFLVAVFGIGGGGVIAPAIALLFRSDMKRAIATAVAATVLLSIYGVVNYTMVGIEAEGTVSPSMGWIYLPALALLIPAAFVASPLGVKVATRLSQGMLTSIVAASMFLIGGRFVLM
jgi:uncharacterized membrane protein YfcA